jgi:drug/metabolite transporter (DMT)-like permease
VSRRPGVGLAALALTFNAFTWGVSWWPLRQLQGQGLHPLWATVLIYSLAVLAITLWRPAAWRTLFTTPVLWVLVLASGTTNAAFNWAVTVGDVVRVILLFYLMPLWAVLLARALLGERITPAALLRVALALAGAALVLATGKGDSASQASGYSLGLPVPRNLAEWLSVLGGFSFALNNVMLKREAERPAEARALAMFLGGALVSGLLALALPGSVPLPPPPATAWVLGTLGMGLWFLAGNLCLQYGATRLPANVTAVVMVTEVLFASASAVALGAGTLSLPLVVGGVLILSASLLSTRSP